jgi:hypothetical protein
MARPARHRRRGERGSALVLAILIMLAMLGLGLMAMKTTKDNAAGTGNLRLSKQARYIAEMGLYHAVTLMEQKWGDVMPLRGGDPTTRIEVLSDGRVRVLDAAGQPLGNAATFPVPAYYQARAGGAVPPAPLGRFGEGARLVPSYTVTIDGFAPAAARPGFGAEQLEENTFCLMHFTARGYIADQALPTAAVLQRAGTDNLFAEASVTAEVVVGRPIPKQFCTRL